MCLLLSYVYLDRSEVRSWGQIDTVNSILFWFNGVPVEESFNL